MLTWMSLMLFASMATVTSADLEGLPLQMEWVDVDGDGTRDLVALMLLTRTEGTVETWFEEGSVRGLYEDQTFKEKYLGTWLNHDGKLEPAFRMPLGQQAILGFALEEGPQPVLALWTRERLIRHHWRDGSWEKQDEFEAPGLLAAEAPDLGAYPFWSTGEGGVLWMVPDLDGLHLLFPDTPERKRFLPYPQFISHENNTGSGRHKMVIDLPRQISIDGVGRPELVFQGDDRIEAHGLDGSLTIGHGEGVLFDLNGDGLADLFDADLEAEPERPRDLPNVMSKIRVHYATAPLVFPAKPDVEQSLHGFILEGMGDDMDLQLTKPFLDINGDGRPDLAGVAFKVSVFQMVKAAATGRIRIKFYIHLALQQENGRFKALPGEPFELNWRINIRRLAMPSLAQVTADFNGDGWIDILMEDGSNLEITPISPHGFATASTWKKKIPKPLRDPDEIFGRDMNGDGRAEFVLIKLGANHTRLGILEAKP